MVVWRVDRVGSVYLGRRNFSNLAFPSCGGKTRQSGARYGRRVKLASAQHSGLAVLAGHGDITGKLFNALKPSVDACRY